MDTWTDPDLGRVSGSVFEDLFWIPLRLVLILFWRGICLGSFGRGFPMNSGLGETQGRDVRLVNVTKSPPGVVVPGVLGIVLRLLGILA